MIKTPKQEGFHMPAEWKEQQAIWMSWPKDIDTFPEDCFPQVQESFATVVKEVSQHQTVKILVDDEKQKQQVTNYLHKRGIHTDNMQFFEIPTMDVWIRDYGPTFLLNSKGQKAYTKWTFNAWGGKYEELFLDNNVFAAGIPEQKEVKQFNAGIVMEGGSIDVNGAGCVLTTKQCLLNKNRNPKLTQKQIEQKLTDYLSVEKVLWLNEGIVGDDTDGHVDDIARFISEDTIAYAIEYNTKDDNFKYLSENEKLLKEMTDVHGKKFKLVPIEMPPAMYYGKRRIPASHLNFLITNKVVLVPTFGTQSDKKAIDTLQKHFPERKVIGIPSKEWAVGFGAVHCSTQQEPK